MGPGTVSAVTLLLLGLFTVSASAACRVSGLWETKKNSNEGTKITIRLKDDGLFSGTYREEGSSTLSNLTGYQQDGDQPTFSFAVKSKTSASTIAHIGCCYLPPNGEDILITTRIVKKSSTHPSDCLKITTTQVNFTRIFVS
ncbi:hypothetical protein NDU88_000203 [Pleurodeles waltl]|uniref:Uncharacterized protein n=1 Tax=Pleurodeles waltl TaxID=8319 RepID=A0AAV7WGT9_PLEWA|nr:hypothetical protein NDU88_000203 [Pleurodeles waltl]